MKSLSFLIVPALVLICGPAFGDPPLLIQATPSLMPLAKDLVAPLHAEGIEIKMVEEAGNSQAIGNLGDGQIDAALITRALTVSERIGSPARHFVEATIGVQAVAVVVSRPVWESGVRALDRKQIADAYESKARNWKEFGGEDRPLLFFEPAHDRGPWEIFATWLYGDLHKAPGVPWQVVADGADAQTTLQFASGAISVAEFRWADRKDVFPLTLIDDSGKSIEPTVANVAAGVYPLVRPVIVAFGNEPAAEKRKMLEFLLSDKGQALVAAHNFVAQSALKGP